MIILEFVGEKVLLCLVAHGSLFVQNVRLIYRIALFPESALHENNKENITPFEPSSAKATAASSATRFAIDALMGTIVTCRLGEPKEM
jgi:hypothetical protein